MVVLLLMVIELFVVLSLHSLLVLVAGLAEPSVRPQLLHHCPYNRFEVLLLLLLLLPWAILFRRYGKTAKVGGACSSSIVLLRPACRSVLRSRVLWIDRQADVERRKWGSREQEAVGESGFLKTHGRKRE